MAMTIAGLFHDQYSQKEQEERRVWKLIGGGSTNQEPDWGFLALVPSLERLNKERGSIASLRAIDSFFSSLADHGTGVPGYLRSDGAIFRLCR